MWKGVVRMKIICEKCDGKGQKITIFQGSVQSIPCEECKRKGYTEIAMPIEEVGRLCRIGNATIRLFEVHKCILGASGENGPICLNSIDELLKWTDGELNTDGIYAKGSTVPNGCYINYGRDLDGCSTQQSEGCSRCVLYRNKVEQNDECDRCGRICTDEEK